MEPTALVALLQEAVPGASIALAPSVDLHVALSVPAEHLTGVALVLRDRPELRFALLAELTAVDRSPHEPRFELVYLLVSIEHRRRLRLKVPLDGGDPHVATVSGIWPAANWFEREVWDMFGIAFDGHPDPRRLLMPEDWEGYPLRKDYPVQIQMTPRTAEAMQLTADEFRANLTKDRLSRR